METYRGKHVILDLFGCEYDLLDNKDQLESILTHASLAAGCTILNTFGYKFEPQGVTVVVTLSESHISVHTVPQENKAWVDIFTCGDHAMPTRALTIILEQLHPKNYKLTEFERG
jgi:S-adenosylmethionine decarboxylase